MESEIDPGMAASMWGDAMTALNDWRSRAERAEAEVERLEDNLSALLCELTGGRLSKTTYDVRTMAREIEAYFQETDDDDLKAAEAALVSEREAHAGLRARLEALADEHKRTCNPAPYTSERALIERLDAALAEPAAPVAAEEGGEQEAGEAQITDHPFSHDWNPGCGECGEPIRRHTHMEVLPDLNAGPLSLDEVRVIPTPPGAVWLDRRAAAPSGSDDTKGGAS